MFAVLFFLLFIAWFCFTSQQHTHTAQQKNSCRKTVFSTLRWARTNSCSTASTSTPTRCSLQRTSRPRRRPRACCARRLRCLVTSVRFARARRAASTWRLARRTKRSSVLPGVRRRARVCDRVVVAWAAWSGRGEPVVAERVVARRATCDVAFFFVWRFSSSSLCALVACRAECSILSNARKSVPFIITLVRERARVAEFFCCSWIFWCDVTRHRRRYSAQVLWRASGVRQRRRHDFDLAHEEVGTSRRAWSKEKVRDLFFLFSFLDGRCYVFPERLCSMLPCIRRVVCCSLLPRTKGSKCGISSTRNWFTSRNSMKVGAFVLLLFFSKENLDGPKLKFNMRFFLEMQLVNWSPTGNHYALTSFKNVYIRNKVRKIVFLRLKTYINTWIILFLFFARFEIIIQTHRKMHSCRRWRTVPTCCACSCLCRINWRTTKLAQVFFCYSFFF